MIIGPFTHPLMLVRFDKTLNGALKTSEVEWEGYLCPRTAGYFGTCNSYKIHIQKPTSPTTSGTRTLLEPHGNCTPAHVNATAHEQEEPITSMFPLKKSEERGTTDTRSERVHDV